MRSLPLALVALLLLAGCNSLGGSPSTPTAEPDADNPTPTPRVVTKTVTVTVTPEPTETTETTTTATPTPTPTPSPAATATPTPTPEPMNDEVGIGEWGRTEHDGHRIDIRINKFNTQKNVSTEDGPDLEAPEGYRWVVAEVELYSHPTPGVINIGYEQWTLYDSFDNPHDPDDEAMRKHYHPYPENQEFEPDTQKAYFVIWLVEYHNDVSFKVVPHRGQSGGTVLFIP